MGGGGSKNKKIGAEQKIRKYLVDNNFIDTIIQLPDNLFYGTGIGTCILVLKKSKNKNGIFFIDASKEFIKKGNKNKLTAKNIQNILNCYLAKSEIDSYAKFVFYNEIVTENYNLSVRKYIKQKNLENINILEINSAIEKTVQKQNFLREEVNNFITQFGNEDE